MALLNAINCLSNVKNTGFPSCFVDIKFINGAILVPKGTTLTTASLSAFQTALTNGLYSASKTSRFFPIYDFEAPKFNNEAKTVQTMATGQKHVVREGFNDWSFQFVQGGITLLQALRSFNGSNWDFFFIDNDPQGSKIIGVIGTAANTITAISSNGGYFWSDPWNPNDGSKISEYMAGFVFDSRLVTDTLAVVQLPSTTIPSIAYPGLADAIVGSSATVNATTKNFNVTLTSSTNVDLGALNSAALSGAGSANWTAAVASSGLPIVVSSSTWVPSTTAGVPGYFTIVLATTNYPTPPAPVLINLAAPSVLVAAGLNYESTAALSIASV